MSSESYDPHGAAVWDYFHGDTSAVITVHNESGNSHPVPVSIFFRGESELLPLEDVALDLATRRGGRVLDIGAGSGCHSLILQQRGVAVCAVDFVPALVEVMRERGVREAHCADIFAFTAPAFDTALMLMNGTVILGTLARLRPFLRHLRRLLKPDGQLLLHSSDLRCVTDTAEPARQEVRRKEGRYFGEMRTQLEYKGKKGAAFLALMVDPETLAAEAAKENWSCEILGTHGQGGYLARLRAAERDVSAG